MSDKVTPYKSLSSIARQLLPKAQAMHRKGMAWRQIARELKVSNTTLHNWRKLSQNQR